MEIVLEDSQEFKKQIKDKLSELFDFYCSENNRYDFPGKNILEAVSNEMLQDIFFYLVKKDIFKSHNPLAALYFIANLITSYSINLANMNLISKELSNELENYSKFLIYISDAADNTNDAKNLH